MCIEINSMAGEREDVDSNSHSWYHVATSAFNSLIKQSVSITLS